MSKDIETYPFISYLCCMKLQKDIGDKVRELHSKGKKVKDIASELICSKQIVYYHISNDYKDKVKALLQKHRLKEEIAYKKRLRQKYENFFNPGRSKGQIKSEFTFKQFLERLMENPKCYLTGRDLDLSDTTSFHPDHIVPVSKGGKPTLDNLGFVCKEANFAKRDTLVDEFIQLCKEVLINKGYKIS